MREELIPVQIPPEPNWTAKQDEEFVEDRLGDDYEGFDELLIRCFDSLRGLSATLRRVLAHFDLKVGHRVDLKVLDLIDQVEEQLQASLSPQQYREFVAEEITTCRFVADQFARVIGVYAADRDLKWLAPLADLGDWIIAATVWLEDGMATVIPDFERDSTVGLPK